MTKHRLTAITQMHLREWGAWEIATICGGRESLSPLEILSLDDVPAQDRLWVVLRSEIMGEDRLRLAACDMASRVLPLYEARHPGDPRPRRAIETARRYARGDVTRGELDTAWAVAWDAGANITAAGDAADAARDAERAAQVNIVRLYLR